MQTSSRWQQLQAAFRRFGQRVGNRLQRWYVSTKHYLQQQPRWRLALYGLGGPIVLGFLAVGLLVLLVRAGVLGPLPSYPDLRNIQNLQASELISEDSIVLGRYYIENRVNADLQEVAPHVIDALVATEDARFFEHRGIDLRAFGRVMVKTILLRDESAGGGSTLSQQLVKNIYGRKSYTFLEMPINKIREMLTARRLENIYTKEELLGMYLNTVPFGHNSYGIKIAARRYFNKAPHQLKVEEAAVLVGMLKAVSSYDPRRNPERSTQRRNVVLAQMVRNGSLEPNTADSLQQLTIALDFQPESHNDGLATYFREHIRLEIDEILAGLRKPDGGTYNLYTDGLRIYTTIDARMQTYAERAVRAHMPSIQESFHKDWEKRKNRPWERTLNQAIRASKRFQQLEQQGLTEEAILSTMTQPVQMTIFDWEDGAIDTAISPLDSIALYTTLLQTGLLAIEPNSGLIRAWVGGINHRFVQYDHVKATRQIGSTMKPLVYAAALESGMRPCEYTSNERQSYAEFANYNPGNSDGEYGGAYSMAGALAKSINTIAVEVGLRAGLGNVINLARRTGIEGHIPAVPGIALGAVEASLLEMVQVYSTFANRGRRPDRLHYLDRIETADGQLIYERERPNPKEFPWVMDRYTAETMNELLMHVVNSGTAARLRSRYRIPTDVGGKTGTTQNQSDGWFLGYTPRLTVGVWVGAEQPSVHFRTLRRGQSSSTALPIWGTFVESVYKDDRFASWRRKGFPRPNDTTLAYLQCPDYFEDLDSLYFNAEQDEFDELDAFRLRLAEINPDTLRILINENPRRSFEELDRYADRLIRNYQRLFESGDNDREERRNFWSRLLFGNRDDNGEEAENQNNRRRRRRGGG